MALLLRRQHGRMNYSSRVLASVASSSSFQGYSNASATTASQSFSTMPKPLNFYRTSSALPVFAANPFQYRVRFKSSSSNTEAAASVKKEEEDKNKAIVAKTTSGGLNLDLGLPALIPEWKKMFRSETLFQDVSAGLTVGCIAVPLSLAIAVASGVPAEVGLVTAAVSGVAGGLMGGTTLAVTGPAAAISLLVVGAVQQHGLECLPFITLACGGLQFASGVTRLGVVAKLVPVSVIAGFTTGVGTLILTGQLPKALGMAAPPGMNPVELLAYIGENVASVNPSAAALAIGTSGAMYFLPKVHPKIPSALLAVGGATLATHSMGLDVALIGAIPSGLEAFQFGIPFIPPTDALPSLTATVLLIYAMTSVESLLSCAALEKMKKTDYKHNPDQELVGQGIANMGAAMFMGMPVTSVIARSGLNVRLNAATRLPALVQAGFVFSSVVFMSESIAMIPMPALSGMLITTGMGMLNPTEFKHCYAVQKKDAVPFATTIGGMLTLGLAEGIGIGCITAMALNYGNSSESSKMKATEALSLNSTLMLPIKEDHKDKTDVAEGIIHQLQFDDHTFHDDAGHEFELDPTKTAAWEVNGPINFISMFEIDNMMKRVKERNAETPMDSIVLDMHGVTSVEFTGMEELVNRLVEVSDEKPIRMVNINDSIENALDQCDPNNQISRYSALSAIPTTTTTKSD